MTRKSRDPALLQYDELGCPMTQSVAMQKGSSGDMPIHLNNKNCSTVAASPDALIRSRGCCGKDAKSLGVMQISDVSRGQCTNDLDESNLDIIMEHEELSDSMMKVQMLSLNVKKLMNEDESECVQLRKVNNKELPASAPVWDNNQDSCNLNRSYPLMSVRQEPVDQEKKQPSLGWSSLKLLHTEASQEFSILKRWIRFSDCNGVSSS